MSGLFMGAVIVLAVIIMIVAISKYKQHPFVVMILVSIFVGLVCGMPADKVIATVKSGFGGILSSIGIVIVAGTIIGTILEKTGAALVMANTILGVVGKARSVLTMSLTGYVTGIPVFCDSGFVILSPIARALADRSRTSLAVKFRPLRYPLPCAADAGAHRYGRDTERRFGHGHRSGAGDFHSGDAGWASLREKGGGTLRYPGQSRVYRGRADGKIW